VALLTISLARAEQNLGLWPARVGLAHIFELDPVRDGAPDGHLVQISLPCFSNGDIDLSLAAACMFHFGDENKQRWRDLKGHT
jgi:hypothetical protein